jgi:hypothetical protein
MLEKTLEDKLRPIVRKLVIMELADEITLNGVCRSFYHKQLASTEAMKTFSGKKVSNNIKVVD